MRKILFVLLALTVLFLSSPPSHADKVGDNWTLPGNYTLKVHVPSGTSYEVDFTDIKIKITAENNGDYTLRDIDGSYFLTNVTFSFDESTNKLTFTKGSNTGWGEDGATVALTPAGFEAADYFLAYETSEATFNPETGEIIFPVINRYYDFAFSWINVTTNQRVKTVVLQSAQQEEEIMEQGDFVLSGLYEFTLGDPYGDKPNEVINVRISENDGAYTIKDVEGKNFKSDITFVFDNKSNKLTFSEINCGDNIYFEPFVYDWPDVITGTYSHIVFDSFTGEIAFQSRAIYGDFGFTWTDKSAMFPSYDPIYTIVKAVQIEDTGDQEPEWSYVGDATFVDGWVLPMLGIDQKKAENQYKVALEQNRDNKSLYRLVDPYASGPAAAYNIHSTKKGYIEFDVTDPEHVLFNKVEAGFAYDDPRDGERKFKELYCVNFLRNKALQYPNNTIAQIISMLKTQMCFTTFNEGVVELGYKDFGGGDIEYDAHYGTEDPAKERCNGYWSNSDDSRADMTARIIFPGAVVEDPEIEGPTEGDITGNMTAQTDLNYGTMYPDVELGDEEEIEVTANYDEDTNELTIFGIYDFKPLTLKVDVENGTLKAEKQLADHQEMDEDGEHFVFDYYYLSLDNIGEGITGKIANTDEGKCEITLDPWWAALYAEDIPYFGFAYLNTVITLDFTIDGLPSESEEPEQPEGPTEGDITGNMTAQTDLNYGTMYPDVELGDEEEIEVTANYDEDTNELTIFGIYDFKPLTLKVDVENGTLKAEKQLADHQEMDEDGEHFVFDYYYLSLENVGEGITGKIANTDEGKCEITLDPWWAAIYAEDIPYFGFAYLNTVITLDFTIEGLPSESEGEEGLKLEGIMNAQIDMNNGMLEEQDLTDPEEYKVSATYNEATQELTFSNFADERAPITFKIDLSTGKAIAEEDQLIYADGDWEYYYGDVKSQSQGVYGKIMNMGENQTLMTVEPWGELLDFAGMAFFNAAYFNTVIVLEGVIPGLEVNAPTLTIDAKNDISYDVEHVADEYKDYAKVTFHVAVFTEGLDDEANVRLFYSGPLHEEDEFVEADHDATTSYVKEASHHFTFELNGLDKSADLKVRLYAICGPHRSEVVTKVFDATTTTGVTEIGADADGVVRYFNLDGTEVKNPEKGIYIKVTNERVEKVVK